MAFCEGCRLMDSAALFLMLRENSEHGCVFWKEFFTISASSRQGCPFCALIVHAVGPALRNFSTKLYLKSISPWKGISQIKILTKDEDKSVGTLAVYADRDSAAARSGDVFGRLIADADSIAGPKQWLAECLSHHRACRYEPGYAWRREDEMLPVPVPLLPTRVVDVGPRDGSEEPSLLEAKGQCAHFIALSHCWGPVQVLQTTLANKAHHELQLPLVSLPKTFQDAVAICRKLDVRYLWIDSLCIIQDSAEDWANEAGLMEDIYKNALVTIAASAGSSADSGCFIHRDRDYMTPSATIPYRGSDGKNAGSIYLTDDRLVKVTDQEISHEPLNQRAWPLQERLLSQRILHYARSQLYWECVTIRVSESGEPFGDKVSFPFPRRRKTGDPDLDFGEWYDTVTEYTGRAMTLSRDKLPALSGLARRFSTYFGAEYVAGLWAEHLPWGLLWRALDNAKPRPSWRTTPRGLVCTNGKLLRPTAWRAPTWSWASLDGRVIFHPRNGSPPVSDIMLEDITTAIAFPSPKSDPFGSLTMASISLTGYTKFVKEGPGVDELQTSVGTIIEGYLYLDYVRSLSQLADEKDFYLLSVSRYAHEYEDEEMGGSAALVLQASGSPHTFKRVGLIELANSRKAFGGAEKRRITLI